MHNAGEDWFCFCFIVWRGALSRPAWRPQSPPSTATPRPSWSSSTSAGTLRRTWRSNRSCWSWTPQSRCGTCTSARCRAPPKSCWTCQRTAASSPTRPSSWTSTTCQIHRERSTARRAVGSDLKHHFSAMTVGTTSVLPHHFLHDTFSFKCFALHQLQMWSEVYRRSSWA